MHDRHLDPPDYPEVPECCGDEMDVLKDGTCVCTVCGAKIEPTPEPDPAWEITGCEELPDDYFPGPEKCPHGNEWTGCDACDHASDIAYDAAREGRFFR